MELLEEEPPATGTLSVGLKVPFDEEANPPVFELLDRSTVRPPLGAALVRVP